MARRVLALTALAVLLLSVGGCGWFQRAQRPAWRDQAEKICLAEKRVAFSAFVQPAREIDGPGMCGLVTPLKVTALASGTVELNSTQTVGCPMTAALDQWLEEVVQPVARARFGVAVTRISSMGAYSCRPIDNLRGAKLSEHAFGNALDVGAFTLADGREITVVKAWKRGTPQERAFLQEVHAGACAFFTTVLAPGSDSFHANHIHLDLAMHGNTSTGPRRYCKPTPPQYLLPPPQRNDGLPNPPDLEEELDVAKAIMGIKPASRTALALNHSAPAVSARPLAPLAPLPPVNLSTTSRARPNPYLPPAPIGAPLQLGMGRSASISDDGVFDPGDVGD